MRKQKTRNMILQAALSLFSEKGYMGTTTKEIAERASVSEVTLFRHFHSKEMLFEEVLIRYSFLPELRKILERVVDAPPDKALFTIGMEFLQNLRKKEQLVRIILSERTVFPQKVKTAHEKISEGLVALMVQYLSSLPGVKTSLGEDIEILANMFLRNVFVFFFTEEILRERKVSSKEVETYLEILVETFLEGIIQPPIDDGGPH